MDFDEFMTQIWESRRSLISDDAAEKKINIQIQGSSQFAFLPLDEENGKTINIIRID